MPTHKPYTEVSSLPANSRGERTILEQHLDQNLATLADAVEILLRAVFQTGGTVEPGTVTVDGEAVRVAGRLAITLDATAGVMVAEQAVSLASVPEGVRCRVVLEPGAGEQLEFAFRDADTQEPLTHRLMAYPGRLTLLQGDAADYPALPPGAAPVARVTRTAGGVTLDATEDDPPVPRPWFAASP